MVVPIILTGVFEAIAKTKKASWKAMKGAMGAVKSAAGPMGAVANTLKVFAPILKVINVLFKVLGAAILKTVLPAMMPLLAMLTSPTMLALMQEIGETIGVALIPAFKALVLALKQGDLIQNVQKLAFQILGLVRAILIPGFIIGIINLVGGLVSLAAVITGALAPIISWLGTLNPSEIARLFYVLGLGISTLIGIMMGGPIGGLIAAAAWGVGMSGLLSYQHGTSYVPQTGPYILHRGEEVISAGKTSKGEIHVHVDLRNAVVDNVDRLSQRIAEAVLIQIG